MPTTPSTDPDTRRRLLDAAGKVFADAGFRAATVRGICRRAGANVAAVNYHFGDKQSLYRAVLEDALLSSIDRHPPDLGLGPKPTAQDRLFAFVHSFLLRILSDAKSDWLMKLMSREMMEPTGALEHLVASVHEPLFTRLRGIVRDIARRDLDEATHVRCCQAVVGQCLFYKHAAEVIRCMGHDTPRSEAEIRALAEHITAFSVGGVRAIAGGKAR
jgi:AcrR family transcriptional regulator